MAASHIPKVVMLWTGSEVRSMLELHEKYGPVVRTAPRQVSFNDASAWKVIYGHKTGGKTRTFEKDPKFYITEPNSTRHIVIADDPNHTRQRRILANSFSDKVCSFTRSLKAINSYEMGLVAERPSTEYFPGTARSGTFAQTMGRLYDHEVKGSHGCR
jgi:cytochrome P450